MEDALEHSLPITVDLDGRTGASQRGRGVAFCVRGVSAALSMAHGARFFGDGEPLWLEGRSQSPCKTHKEARREKHLLVKALRRSASRSALVLARKLEGCRARTPCLSGACAVCGRAGQRLATHVIGKLIDHHTNAMLAVTAISDKRAIRYGRLDRHDLFYGIDKRLHDALAAVGLSAVGGLDVSGNEHATGAFAPHFMPHGHFLVSRADMAKVEKAFREWFPKTERTPRPVRMTKFDGAVGGIAYQVKADVFRRLVSPPKRLPNGTRSTFGSRKKQFFKAERIEIAIALDDAGLDARLFLHGYDLVVRNGNVELVPTRKGQRATT
jgi:hypothetical protein